MVLAWDQNFTKVTLSERVLLLEAQNSIDSGEAFKSNEVSRD